MPNSKVSDVSVSSDHNARFGRAVQPFEMVLIDAVFHRLKKLQCITRPAIARTPSSLH